MSTIHESRYDEVQNCKSLVRISWKIRSNRISLAVWVLSTKSLICKLCLVCTPHTPYNNDKLDACLITFAYFFKSSKDLTRNLLLWLIEFGHWGNFLHYHLFVQILCHFLKRWSLNADSIYKLAHVNAYFAYF